MRKRVHNKIDKRRDEIGCLLFLPPVLYGPTEIYQPRWPCREIQEKVQHRIMTQKNRKRTFPVFLKGTPILCASRFMCEPIYDEPIYARKDILAKRPENLYS